MIPMALVAAGALLMAGAPPVGVGSDMGPGPSQPDAAHPFHVSSAEFDANRKTGQLEVGLSVDIADLERVLGIRAGKAIRLDTGKDREAAAQVDRLIQDYLAITFRVVRADGQVAPIQWVGKQLDVHGVWLFFTCDLGRSGRRHGLKGVQVTHQVLCNLEHRQMNSVRCRDGRWRRSFVFSREAPTRLLRPGVQPPEPQPGVEPQPQGEPEPGPGRR